jgi:Glycosyl transferases group 1
MPTWQRFAQSAFQCARYEAQDVIFNSDDVDLIYIDPAKHFNFQEKLQRRLLWRDVTQRLAYVNPGLRPVRLTKEYDLFFVHCQTWWDLLYVNAIVDWQDHCKTSVCWMDELWASAVPKYKYWIQSLKRFDHLIVGMAGTVQAVSQAIGRPCHYVPGAVDTVRFTPYPDPPARVIDVYSMGRRWEGIHRSLLKSAESNEFFYLYDTLQTGESQAPDYRQHRNLLANLAKRSRYFMVAPGKINVPEETKGQVEIGLRYYEGAAAGAVMIGQPADCEPFRQMFDWPDSVIEIKPDGSDTVDVIRSLVEQPERLLEISRRNAAEALLRHDWVYRWKKILAIAGLEPTPALGVRERRLRELAELPLTAGH